MTIQILKSLADTNRLRILNLLSAGELCVCDLETVLGLQQANLSRHLGKLRDAGLVDYRRVGSFAHYRLRLIPKDQQSIVQSAIAAVQDDEPWKSDKLKLAVTNTADRVC